MLIKDGSVIQCEGDGTVKNTVKKQEIDSGIECESIVFTYSIAC